MAEPEDPSPPEGEAESEQASKAALPEDRAGKPPSADGLRRFLPLALLGGGIALAGLIVLAVSWHPAPLPNGPHVADKVHTGNKKDDPSKEPAPNPEGPLVSNQLNDPAGQLLLATQSEGKRNLILVIDLYRQILSRYPNAPELKSWTEPKAKDPVALEAMRERAASEEEIANYIAGALFDEPTVKARAPALEQANARANALSTTAIIARAISLREDLPRGDEQRLVNWLARGEPFKPENANLIPTMRAELEHLTGTTDIGEHFIEDANDDAVEAAAMRTLLRSGKLLVLNGNELDGPSRYVLVIGFDRAGDFIVRDPSGHLPEKVKGPFLMAFLRHPGLSQPGSKSGFWLDLPGGKTRVKCVSHAVEAPSEPEPIPAPELSWDSPNGMTGVIPGAQVNLTPLRIPGGEHSLRGTMSVTAPDIDAILTAAHSPAAGSGEAFVKYGQYFNIDPIYALAFFRRESVYGAHPRWIGRKGPGDFTKNIGNIRYVGHPNPQRLPQYSAYNGFRDYATWEDGIHDWFKLIAQDSNYANLHTAERIIPKYAPSFENDTSQYVKDVVRWVQEWREHLRSNGQVLPAAAQAAKAARPEPEVDCR